MNKNQFSGVFVSWSGAGIIKHNFHLFFSLLMWFNLNVRNTHLMVNGYTLHIQRSFNCFFFFHFSFYSNLMFVCICSLHYVFLSSHGWKSWHSWCISWARNSAWTKQNLENGKEDIQPLSLYKSQMVVVVISDSNGHTFRSCDFSSSAIWALSVSNKTGANRIIELVKNIHDALHVKLYSDLVVLKVRSVATSHADRTNSGNISVRPHNLSDSVSSGSCNRAHFRNYTLCSIEQQ